LLFAALVLTKGHDREQGAGDFKPVAISPPTFEISTMGAPNTSMGIFKLTAEIHSGRREDHCPMSEARPTAAYQRKSTEEQPCG
jgi:hypothetical protein